MSAEAAQNLFDLAPMPQRPRKPRPPKAPGAFLTIGELAEQLQIEQHVLRFWESKFPQIQPVKRAGGRRYYRPDDVELLGRIQVLLYRDGYTIRGVQNLLNDADAVTEAAKPMRHNLALLESKTLEYRRRVEMASVLAGAQAASEQMLDDAGQEPQHGAAATTLTEYMKIPRQSLSNLVDELVKLRRLIDA